MTFLSSADSKQSFVRDELCARCDSIYAVRSSRHLKPPPTSINARGVRPPPPTFSNFTCDKDKAYYFTCTSLLDNTCTTTLRWPLPTSEDGRAQSLLQPDLHPIDDPSPITDLTHSQHSQAALGPLPPQCRLHQTPAISHHHIQRPDNDPSRRTESSQRQKRNGSSRRPSWRTRPRSKMA